MLRAACAGAVLAAAIAIVGVRPAPVAANDAPPPAVLPLPAADFVDSIGVNVHLSDLDTAYVDYAAVRAKLLELGLHAIRDEACLACTQQRARVLDLAGAGIRTDFIMGRPGGRESLSQLVAMVAGPLRPATLAVEGPNEYDRSGALLWPQRLRAYQQQLYGLVRGTPALDGVPVLGPSLARPQSASQVGSLASWLDCASIHPYPAGGAPTDRLDQQLAVARTTAGDKPVCATEIGWQDATSPAGGAIPTSDAAAAIYVPRVFLDFFSAGLPRTFLYELVDERADPAGTDAEHHYGLLRSDFTEKPAFASLRRLIALVAPSTQARPVAVRLRVAGPGDVRRLVLQQDARHQVVVLWRDATVWDPESRQDVAVAPEAVHLQFARRGVRRVVVSTVAPAPGRSRTIRSPRDVRVDLGAQPVVLTLTRPSP